MGAVQKAGLRVEQPCGGEGGALRRRKCFYLSKRITLLYKDPEHLSAPVTFPVANCIAIHGISIFMKKIGMNRYLYLYEANSNKSVSVSVWGISVSVYRYDTDF